jgi:hypothetical protein
MPWPAADGVLITGVYGSGKSSVAAVAPITATPGSIELLVVAYFLRDLNALHSVREVLGAPMRLVCLSVPWPDIEQRLASDVTSGRRDDLRDAASSEAEGEGVGV